MRGIAPAPGGVTRRKLLRGGPHGVAVLRPPWAIHESAFTDACTGCGDCVRACPEQVLVQGGGGLPVFDPLRGECSFCGDCAPSCDARLFRAIEQRPWTLRAQVGQDCLATRGVVCSSCRDACATSAIRFAPSRAVAAPEVLSERCTGCGACVAGCPAGALSLSAISEEAMNA